MPSPDVATAQSVPAVHRRPSYVNYDVFAWPQNVYGEFAYGMRLGAGVAQVGLLARALGEGRGITLLGAAWQRHSNITGSTLTIGDAESYRGKYEESVRFDGVQYAGRNVSYAFGWERTDFPDSPVHFGSLMAQLTASKDLGRRLTAEAHFFADANSDLIGAGATWTTAGMGRVRFGAAPARGRGVTGFVAYAFTSPRLSITIDDRVWGAQAFDPGAFAPPNYRQLRATAEYRTSLTDTMRLTYAAQSQGGLPIRTTTLGYAKRIEGTELHVDLVTSAAGSVRNTGLATYLSIPVGVGLTLSEQGSVQGGAALNSVTLKQNIPDSGIGRSYALDFGSNSAAVTDARFVSGTPGSTTQLELSRFGGQLGWNAEFSGAVTFINGKALAANQKIDQSTAFDVLKGRSAAALTILAESGQSLPAGSLIRVIGETGAWRSDADGRVQITDIATGPQTLIVTLPTSTCVVGVTIPPNVNGPSDLGKQVCRRV
jgi:outer membrane usher protein FimD/PapC